MRILILGAGALGGYYGARLIQGGAAEEVAFLVRPKRQAQIAREGLVVKSPLGDFALPVKTVAADAPGNHWDVVLLSCKSYDLESAIEAIRPAVGPGTAVLPVLNGLSHLSALQRAFGDGAVLGGVAKIAAMLTPEGHIRHMAPPADLLFGEIAGGMSARVEALARAFQAAPHIKTTASPAIMDEMWAKLVMLGSLAALTVLMRGHIGQIIRAGGQELILRMFRLSAAIAAANGHPVPDETLTGMERMFTNPKSTSTASMFRDLKAGGPIEIDHIVGFLVEAGKGAALDVTLLEAALVSGRTYEAQRAEAAA
ncbi:2-dehydropantoate 2-reductase [Roseococcus sp. SYP-B2431]|uniref:2-dehydropantoate 2-reductase n=1 Tax=Roseococcus sp. SYP-B2431 TaxID=2496640 RepID=UPI00103B9E70|nr:2-dehydropantoate 2-reductase [Roseococcus sp. SYP-B2431]TCI00815.1 2-dehydropantoate 2-reductase [Roseococcus sp. SYP-B2431]